MPIHLGYHDDDLADPYWCALDFSLPTVIIPNYLCEECSGKKFTPSIVRSGGSIDEDDNFEYPHKMTYWKYTEGAFKVREEEEFMIFDYDSAYPLSYQVQFRNFEFYSILEDHDQQQLDSLFGLGLPSPEHSLETGHMNMFMWMQEKGYTEKKVASVYIRNNNGVDAQKVIDA